VAFRVQSATHNGEGDMSFDDIFKAYPARETNGRRVKIGKRLAKPFYEKALKEISEAELLAAVKAYGRAQNPAYVKDCFRWLRDGGWEDDYGVDDKPHQRPYAAWTQSDKDAAVSMARLYTDADHMGRQTLYTTEQIEGLVRDKLIFAPALGQMRLVK